MNGRAVADWIIHKVAKGLREFHWMIGITTLESDATPRQERSFVLMWIGLIIFIVLWFVVLVHFL